MCGSSRTVSNMLPRCRAVLRRRQIGCAPQLERARLTMRDQNRLLGRLVFGACAASLGVAGCSSHSERSAEVGSTRSAITEMPVIAPRIETAVLHGYDDAPRAVDSDDPAIWV